MLFGLGIFPNSLSGVMACLLIVFGSPPFYFHIYIYYIPGEYVVMRIVVPSFTISLSMVVVCFYYFKNKEEKN